MDAGVPGSSEQTGLCSEKIIRLGREDVETNIDRLKQRRVSVGFL
jgi:hypothetical protein